MPPPLRNFAVVTVPSLGEEAIGHLDSCVPCPEGGDNLLLRVFHVVSAKPYG